MWFQVVLDHFRPFLVLVSTERLNVDIDFMCSFFCKTLTFKNCWMKICVHLQAPTQPFLEAHVAGPTSYLSENFKLPKCWTSEVPHPSCPISNCPTFQTVGIYIFCLYENPPVCHTCFWYLQIFSRVLPWLNLDYWITCQLCQFRCKSVTIYVLHNFSSVLADWYFSWLYLNFHWLSFCEFFSGVFFSLAKENKTPGKKWQKIFPQTLSSL